MKQGESRECRAPRGKVRAWIEAMRLRTLPVSLAGVVAGTGYAFRTTGEVKWGPAVICVMFALLAQIASNFANEYYDYRDGLDRQGREGPRRGVTEGDITPGAMKTAVFVTLGAACGAGLSLIWWGGWWLLLPGVAIAVGAMAYSTGPWPLSRHALGEAAVVIFFGIAPVCLTYYLQTGGFGMRVFAGSLAFGLMGANVLMVNNIRDIPDDRAVGKTTVAGFLGHRAATLVYVMSGLTAGALAGLSAPAGALMWIAGGAYGMLTVAAGVRMWKLRGRRLTPLLGLSALGMLAVSVAVAAG